MSIVIMQILIENRNATERKYPPIRSSYYDQYTGNSFKYQGRHDIICT